jgi:hypothetical protein
MPMLSYFAPMPPSFVKRRCLQGNENAAGAFRSNSLCGEKGSLAAPFNGIC